MSSWINTICLKNSLHNHSFKNNFKAINVNCKENTAFSMITEIVYIFCREEYIEKYLLISDMYYYRFQLFLWAIFFSWVENFSLELRFSPRIENFPLELRIFCIACA